MLDAGQVGTEMLYFLVGSRDLDGGLMCTASHNPAAYTGAKIVERGAVPLAESAIQELRDDDRRRPRRRARAAAASRRSTSATSSAPPRWRSSTPPP